MSLRHFPHGTFPSSTYDDRVQTCIPLDSSRIAPDNTIAYGFSGCRPDGAYDVVEFAVRPGHTCDDDTCVQHFHRSNYECFRTEFPDLFLHVECHIPHRVHKVFTVNNLNSAMATALYDAFCPIGSGRCENFASDLDSHQVAFDYLRPAEPSFRRRRTTNPCDDLYSSENGEAAMLECSVLILGAGACADVESTANFTGTPVFPSVGSANFVACGDDGDCTTAGLDACVENACVAAAGVGSSTEAPTTAAAVPTTTTTVSPVPPEEAFPGAFYGTVGTVAAAQAAAILVEVLAPVMVGNGGGGRAVDAAGLLTESFL